MAEENDGNQQPSQDSNQNSSQQQTGGSNGADSADSNPGGGRETPDIQAEIQRALQSQQAEFVNQLKEITGFESLQAFKEHQLKEQGKLQELLQAKEQEAAQFRQRFEQMAVRAQVLQAASAAVDAEVVLALLAPAAKVDGDGNVTIDGQPADKAVERLLKDKPYLARSSGNQGSGSPQNPSGGKQMPRSQFLALNPKDQLAFVQSGGAVTD